MTIICAIHDPNEKCTWIGADSRTTFGNQIFDHSKKWHPLSEGRWIGHCGDARSGHLIEKNAGSLAGHADMYDLADAVGALMRSDNWQPKGDPGAAGYFGASFIVATREGVWGIACDLTLIPVPSGVFWADGSGEGHARGAAHALMPLVEPREVLRGAIEAAKANDSGCGGEPFIERIG